MFFKSKEAFAKVGIFFLILAVAEAAAYYFFIRGAANPVLNVQVQTQAPAGQPDQSLITPERSLQPVRPSNAPPDYRDKYLKPATSTPSVRFEMP